MSSVAKNRHETVTANALVRSLFLASLMIWLSALDGSGSMWTDPEWEQMLKDSDVIALVEVVEGGRFFAKVRPVTVFKGQLPNDSHVTGYNNGHWPEEGIKEESFQTRQRYYLFLKSAARDRIFVDILNEEAKETGSEEKKRAAAAANAGQLWIVWTPSAGDLPVQGNQVQYSLTRTSYPSAAPKRNRAKFERILKAAISFQIHHKPDVALLGETLKQIRDQQRRFNDPAAKESELAHLVACYFLTGGRDYNDVFATIAAGKDARARFMVARLLGSTSDERAEKLLFTMLSDQDTLVQGEVVRQLGRRSPENVGAVLLSRLEKAGEGAAGPRGLMDPIRNRLDGGKIEIVRALGELKYQAATPALLRLIESSSDSYSLEVVLKALEKIGHQDYSAHLAKALSNERLIHDITKWVRDHRIVGMKKPLEEMLDHLPGDDIRRPIHLGSVSEALGVIGDDETAAKLVRQLDELSSHKVAGSQEGDAAKDIIDAFAGLHYRPARDAIERSFFYWFGIDSTFATKPELMKLKDNLQTSIETKARKCLADLERVDTTALVFIDNRKELASGEQTEPKYHFLLDVDIRSDDQPVLKAEAFEAHLVKEFGTDAATIRVTRWLTETYGESSGATDGRLLLGADRIGLGVPSLFLWRWAQYVQATRDPRDLEFAKFLLESGFAEQCQAYDSINGVFGSDPIK